MTANGSTYLPIQNLTLLLICCLWLSWGFNTFYSSGSSYETIYGAVAAVPVFLVWIYTSWMVIILGAVFAASFPDWWESRSAVLGADLSASGKLQVAVAVLARLMTHARTGRTIDVEDLVDAAPLEARDEIVEQLTTAGYLVETENGCIALSRDLYVTTLHDLARDLGLSLGLDPASEEAVPEALRARLGPETEAVRDRLLQISTTKGIKFRFNTHFEYIKPCDEGGYFVKLSDCDEEKADLVMFAVGRIPNTEGLGLDKAGVELGEGGEIKVDRFSKTNVDHIYAVGDVTDRVQLTPVAIREGQAFAETVFGDGDPVAVDHSCVPSAVFSHPPIAAVGMTEGEAKEALGSVKVYLSDFRPMKNVLAGRNERSLMKMICDGDSGKIVGIHMIAPEAPEMMQAAAIAVKAGLTKADFDATVAIHPTMAEELVLMR